GGASGPRATRHATRRRFTDWRRRSRRAGRGSFWQSVDFGLGQRLTSIFEVCGGCRGLAALAHVHVGLGLRWGLAAVFPERHGFGSRWWLVVHKRESLGQRLTSKPTGRLAPQIVGRGGVDSIRGIDQLILEQAVAPRLIDLAWGLDVGRHGLRP